MDITTYVVIGILVLWLFYRKFLVGKGIEQITLEELKPLLGEKNRQFIDVRTPGEFRRNHIKGFKNIPLNEFSQRTNELSADQEVFVICQSGIRSGKACQQLKKKGFERITNIKGGVGSYHG